MNSGLDPLEITKRHNGGGMVEFDLNQQSDRFGKVTEFLNTLVLLRLTAPRAQSAIMICGIVWWKNLWRKCLASPIKVRKKDARIAAETAELRFKSPKPLTSLNVDYLSLSVRSCVPDSLRCFRCLCFRIGKDASVLLHLCKLRKGRACQKRCSTAVFV